jgi:hypothetical protein
MQAAAIARDPSTNWKTVLDDSHVRVSQIVETALRGLREAHDSVFALAVTFTAENRQ